MGRLHRRTLLGAAHLTLGCSPLLDTGEATYGDAGDTSNAGLPLFSYLKMGPDVEPDSQFGYTLDLYANSAVVAAPYADVRSAANAGRIYLFEALGAGTAPIEIRLPHVSAGDGPIPGDLFPPEAYDEVRGWTGLRVQLDWDLLVVGSAGEDSGDRDKNFDESAPEAGAVFVYSRDALDRDPQYIKADYPDAGDLFGFALALSRDWLAVGAPGDDSAPSAGLSDNSLPDSGAVYLYRRGPNGLEPPLRLKPDDGRAGDFFGGSLALAGDLLAVSAVTRDAHEDLVTELDPETPGLGIGGVYLYRLREGLSGSEWTFEDFLESESSKPRGFFGFAIAVSENRVAASAIGVSNCHDWMSDNQVSGAVYVFRKEPSKWVREECLVPGTSANDRYFSGWSIALYDRWLTVGAPGESPVAEPGVSLPLAGGAYLYERGASGRWNQSHFVPPPSPNANDVFGLSVDFAPGLLAVGAPRESGGEFGPNANLSDESRFESGAVFVYEVLP